MQADSFDKFSITRLWLLVRREILMLTFWEYFMIFIMPFLLISFILWSQGDILADTSEPYLGSLFVFYIFPTIIYVSFLGSLYSNTWQSGHKILPNPFPRGMLPVRIMEKFISDFFCFAVLFPLTIQFFIFLPFLIFLVDFSIWLNLAAVFFAICSPLIAFKFLRISMVENTSLRRHYDAVPYLGETIEFISLMVPIFGFIFYGEFLSSHYLAMAAIIITVIFWWATYRIRLKNAKR